MNAATSNDRLPRASEAEKLVLGSIVAFPDCAADVFGKLHARDFIDKAHQAVYAAMLDQHTRGLGVDPPLLAAELKEHPEFSDGNAAGFLLDLGQSVATVAHVAYYVDQVIEASRKRYLLSVGEAVIDSAMNGQTSEQVFNALWADVEEFRREATADKPPFAAIRAAEFASAKYELRYIVDRVLAESQPCTLGGPKKALKTSLALDLAMSVATGGYFLGKFPVVNRRDVLMCSGESGLAVLQETAHRICRVMGCELASIDGLTISPNLPRLYDADNLRDFERFVEDSGAGVLILDPLYLMLTGDDAGNLFKQGALLRNISDVCQQLGATLVLCHHAKSTVANPFAPPELDNLAWAGCAEFSRQWLLLSRREQYEPGSGLHRLWFSIGGSAGHNSLWAVDVDEGSIDDDGGRQWAVTVIRADEARDAAEQRKVDAKADQAQKQFDSDREAVRRVLANYPDGLAPTTIRDRAQISGRRWPRALEAMIERAELIEVEVVTGNPPKPRPGYKLTT